MFSMNSTTIINRAFQSNTDHNLVENNSKSSLRFPWLQTYKNIYIGKINQMHNYYVKKLES